MLVTTYLDGCLCYWDIKQYKKINDFRRIYTYVNSHMIKAGDGLITVLVVLSQDTIVIVNCDKGCVKKMQEKCSIGNASSLCLVDCESFVYINKEIVI